MALPGGRTSARARNWLAVRRPNPLGELGEVLLQVSELRSEHVPDSDVRGRLDRRGTAAIADDRQFAKEVPRPQSPDLLVVPNDCGRPVLEDVERVSGSALLREVGATIPFLDVEPRSDLLQFGRSQLGEQ